VKLFQHILQFFPYLMWVQ